MRIVVISDTHAGRSLNRLQLALDKLPFQFDMLVHCGDFTSREALRELQTSYSLKAVWGNADDEEVREELPEELMIDIPPCRIWVWHGHGTRQSTEDRVWKRFADRSPDMILFGHSHQPIIKTRQGTLILNPGSLTQRRREPRCSFAILDLEPERVEARLIFF